MDDGDFLIKYCYFHITVSFLCACQGGNVARFQKEVLSGKVKNCIHFFPTSPLPTQTKYNTLMKISLGAFPISQASSLPVFLLCPLPHSHLCPSVRPLTESSRRPSGCHWGSLCFGWCCSSSGPVDLMVLGKGSSELSRLQRRKQTFISWTPLATDARGCLSPMQAAVRLLHVPLLPPAGTRDTFRRRFNPLAWLLCQGSLNPLFKVGLWVGGGVGPSRCRELLIGSLCMKKGSRVTQSEDWLSRTSTHQCRLLCYLCFSSKEPGWN